MFRRGEADLDAYARRFDRYYKSGKIGLSFDQIPAELIAESPHLAKVAFDAGVRDAKETTLSDFTSNNTMEYNGQITEANGLPEELLNYQEPQVTPHDTERSKSSLEGSAKLNFKKLFSQTAEEVNNSLKALGYTYPPYRPGTIVDMMELTGKSKFVRVYDGVNSQQSGGWVMKVEDIDGLTQKQIQNKFALPSTPKYITDVIFNSGTKLRTGKANGLFGFDGGGIQFDLIGEYVGEFVNPRLLP